MNQELSNLLRRPIGDEYDRYKILVTPAIATAILDNQEAKQAAIQLRQRKLFGPRVQKYAEAMKNGQWDWGVSPIHLASNGAVINGLHRLYACVQSGVSFWTDIFVNSSVQLMCKIDPKSQGRSLGENLTIHGFSNTTRLAQILQKAFAFNQGALISLSANKMNEQDLLSLAFSEQDELEEAAAFATENPHGRRLPLVGFMYYAYARAGLLTPRLREALVSLRDGAELKANSMLLKFYAHVCKHGQALKEKRLYGQYFAVLNAVLAGEEINVRGLSNSKLTVLRPVDPDEHPPKRPLKKAKAAAAGK